MSFNTLTLNATNYNHTKNGKYLKEGLPFRGLDDSFVVSGGKLSPQGATSASLNRTKQITDPNDSTKKNRLSVTVTVSATDGFTAADVDTFISDLSTVADVAFITRWLNGES